MEPGQHAYKRSRETEMVLTEIMDFAHRGLNRGRFVYMVSFDVSGAFDSAPHRRLTAALEEYGVDPYIRRVVHRWLRERTFQVRLRAHGEIYRSSARSITRGLPERGILSPVLWIMFFDGFLRYIDG